MTTMRITYRCPNCSQVDNHADNCPSRDKQRLSLTNDYEGVITEQPASGAGSESDFNELVSLAAKNHATYDTELSGRLLVLTGEVREQHSTLIEQRDTARALVTRLTIEKQKVEQDRKRLVEALRDVGVRLHGVQLHASAGTENAYDLASDLRGIRDEILSTLTTIEQEGETR